MSRGSIPWLVVLLQPLLWLWPLPRVAGRELVGEGSSEVADHLWGWWALGREGGLVAVQTELIAFPGGAQVQLIDPLHRLPFALGSLLGGPTLGWAAVLCFGLMVGGAAGLLLAQVTGSDWRGRVLGAVAGGSAATLVGVGADGITEGLGVGWVGIQLACLLWLARAETRREALGRAGLLGLSLGAATWSGPYNAVWCALIDVPLGLFLLRRTAWPVLGGAVGAVLGAPVWLSALDRPEGMPGTASRAAMELPLLPEEGWRGSVREGVDVLDLIVPDVFTGVAATAPTTAYLGVVLVALALVGGARSPRASWPWLGAAVSFAVLALGPWLMLGGAVAELGGRPLVAPAGLLEQLPVLGLISRWYRAGGVAVLLLVPLAVRALRGPWLLVGAVLVGLDARIGSPVPWPLPSFAWPDCTACEVLDGPVANLPAEFPQGWEGRVAGLDFLHQVDHGQPTNGLVDSRDAGSAGGGSLGDLQRALSGRVPDEERAGRLLRGGARKLAGDGFRYLVVHRSQVPIARPELVESVLGAPVAQDDDVVIYALGEP